MKLLTIFIILTFSVNSWSESCIPFLSVKYSREDLPALSPHYFFKDIPNQSIPLIFSVTTEAQALTLQKQIAQAWIKKGAAKADSVFFTPKILNLKEVILLFARSDKDIYENIILKSDPRIHESSLEHLAHINLYQREEKLNPSLEQVFLHIKDEQTLVPTTILFPIASDIKKNRELLAKINIKDFQELGESVFASINKSQFNALLSSPLVEELGLQF